VTWYHEQDTDNCAKLEFGILEDNDLIFGKDACVSGCLLYIESQGYQATIPQPAAAGSP
jgi:hypothetical protein